MSIKPLYLTSVKATGGRDGDAVSEDGKLDVKLSTPKGLGGAGGEGTNPEQLFAAGYAACFLNAMKYIAGLRKTSFPTDATVTAQIGIGPQLEGEGFGLEAKLTISLPGYSQTESHELTEAAHKVCPYSNATRNNISVTLEIV